MYSLIAIFLLIFVLFIRFRSKRARLYHLMDQFDGPPGIPILGNALDFKYDTKEMCEHLIENYAKKFEDNFIIWILHVPFLIIFKPEDIQILSKKPIEKDHTYNFLTELLGDGLLTNLTAKWKQWYKFVIPAFQTSYVIKNVLKIFHHHSRFTVNNLENERDTGKEFDIWPYIVKSTFGAVCEFSLNYSTQEHPEVMKGFSSKMYQKSSDLVAKRIYRPWLYPDFIFTIYKYLTGQQKFFERAQWRVRQAINERKSGLIRSRTDSEGNEIKDIFDMLEEAKIHYKLDDDNNINDQIMTIILSATDTSATVMSCTLVMMAIKNDIQEMVYQELKEIFGDSDRMPNPNDLKKMIFTQQCIQESLRWLSLTPILIRSSQEEIQLSDGRIIPTGVKIIVCPFMIHHDKKIYPNPYTWNPDNFSPEKVKSRKPGSFIPFGFGQRECPGNKYAMISMKTLISTILRKYKLRTSLKAQDIHLDVDFILRFSGGYPVELQSRNKNQ